MKNPLILVLGLVVALALGVTAFFMLGENDVSLSLTDPGTEVEEEGTGEIGVQDATAKKPAAEPTAERTAHAGGDNEEVDEFYVRSLAGFRGRLVLEGGVPAVEKPVQLYRLDQETAEFPPLFAEDSSMKLHIEIQETQSAADGTFVFRGVYPQVIYLIVADRGGENQLIHFVQKTPGAGEMVDLGDLLMPSLGTLIGHVVDEDGSPVSGAMIRAADVPKPMLEYVPVERLDPKGGVIIAEGGTVMALTMPPVAQRVFDLMPIPKTMTDSEGAFTLRGVQPGPNVLVVNKRGLQPMLKPVRVKAGEERKVGKLRLREGEIVEGRVRDTAGQPVVGAEVLVASKNSIPVHFGSFAEPTDAEGRFSMAGLIGNQVYVAVRRSPKDPMVVHGPSPVAADVEIKLPARHTLTLAVQDTAGRMLSNAKLKLVRMQVGGPPVMEFASAGFVSFIGLEDRLEKTEDGKLVVKDLDPGPYKIAIQVEGYAAVSTSVTLTASVEEKVVLKPSHGVDVFVVDAAKKPVRNAKVYMMNFGDYRKRVQVSHVYVGRTDAEGYARVREAGEGTLRVTASHPGFGKHHGEVKLPSEKPVTITMLEAGHLTGVLLNGGEVPKPGKYTVMVNRHWRDRGGALEDMPLFAAPDLEGKFSLSGLAPGKYFLQPIASMSLISSPGGIVKMTAASAMVTSSMQEFEIQSGQTTHVEVDATGRQKVTGPSARITGSVMVNGQPGKGSIRGWGRSGRMVAEVDAAGRFDLGQVGVGPFSLEYAAVSPENASLDLRPPQLWSHSGEIEEGKDLQFDITVDTGSVEGSVVDADGNPMAGVTVVARGVTKPFPDQPKRTGAAEVHTMSDRLGRFRFGAVPAGKYRVEVKGKHGSGHVKGLEVKAALPLAGVKVALGRVYTVEGKVDFTVWAKKPEGVYIRGSDQAGTNVKMEDGSFVLEGLTKGKHELQVYAWGRELDGSDSMRYELEVVGDLKDVVVRPVAKKPRKVRVKK